MYLRFLLTHSLFYAILKGHSTILDRRKIDRLTQPFPGGVLCVLCKSIDLFYFMVINIKGYDVLIDDEDYERVRKYKWHIQKSNKSNTLYIIRQEHYYKENGKRSCKIIRLHNFLMGSAKGMDTDHINGNAFDNRKCNLRICTHAENTRNQKIRNDNISGYKGVSWHKQHKKWRAQIRNNYKRIHLGYFSTPELAHKAYCEAASKYHGEFARFE